MKWKLVAALAVVATAAPVAAQVVITPGTPITPPEPGTQAPAPPAQAAPSPAPAGDWLPRGTATIQALDKVNARHQALTIPVGGSATFGSLSIAVQSCLVHPPNQARNAIAFLVIQDQRPGAPGFRGWMFASAPEVSMLEHPIYDVRVLGCS